MSNNPLAARIKRIEEKLEEIAPVRTGLAKTLNAAREAFLRREATGEPEPERPMLPADPHSSWASQELRRRLNEASEQMADHRAEVDARRAATRALLAAASEPAP